MFDATQNNNPFRLLKISKEGLQISFVWAVISIYGINKWVVVKHNGKF